MKRILLGLLLSFCGLCTAQEKLLHIRNQYGSGIAKAIVQIRPSGLNLQSDSSGSVRFALPDTLSVQISVTAWGYGSLQKVMRFTGVDTITLEEAATELQEVAIEVGAAEQSKSNSAFNVDVLSAKYFQKTTTSSLLDAAALIPGLRAQVNCNVCNTAEIRINGMDGPYTLVLIDNVPVIGALSSVYGLMGIPTSLIENVEITKGPSSAFFGSEAMAGVINVTTKHPGEAEKIVLDYNASSYNEHQFDLALAKGAKSGIHMLAAVNAFNYTSPVDLNKDNFTDLSLQQRITVFFKFTKQHSAERSSSIAFRAVYENRWGGELNWSEKFRGGDSIYGESIYIKRAEVIGHKAWRGKLKLKTDYAVINHNQDAAYGNTSFKAQQLNSYVQTYFNAAISSRQSIGAGHTIKYLHYDDNTAATQAQLSNAAENTFLTGLFVEHNINSKNNYGVAFNSGFRMDWHSVYGFIPTPRLALRWKANSRFTLRANAGTGYRVVNVFTEDHAALSGARKVIFLEQIKPERSLSGLVSVNYKMAIAQKHLIVWDASAFYYHFYNKIAANYEQQGYIIYKNLQGHAFSRGLAIAANYPVTKGFSASLAYNFTDVQLVSIENGQKNIQQQWYNPKHSVLFSSAYFIKRINTKIDVTGSYAGSQRLPVQTNDYRKEIVPGYFLVNALVTKSFSASLDLYCGVKNIFDFLPVDPLMRPFDPFNKGADDSVSNPNAYVFDTTYNYAPFQRRKFTIGLKLRIK